MGSDADGDIVVDLPDAVPAVSCFSPDELFQGPARLAWGLCRRATPNEDQIKPVALVAIKMEAAWQQVLLETPGLEATSGGMWECRDGGHALLPVYGALCRLLLIGGGGAGKSTIINKLTLCCCKGIMATRVS